MGILNLLEKNKGTVSSALGKELAVKVLDGEVDILHEAIELSSIKEKDFNMKSVRSGAAKIVEIVAEKRPELVAPYLEKLLLALSVDEPQTRWMIIRTMGFCAHLNKSIAKKALPYAEKYIKKKEGLCIASSADLFLGDFGTLSQEDAQVAFSLLELSMDNMVLNEQDWLLEAFIKIYPQLEKSQKDKIYSFAESYENSSRKTTQARVKKIFKMSIKD